MLAANEKQTPMRRNVTIDEVGNAGAFLCSDLASGISGEILYVDGGFNTTAMGSLRSEEHTSELQSLMRISYAVFCLKKKYLLNIVKPSKHHHLTNNVTAINKAT